MSELHQPDEFAEALLVPNDLGRCSSALRDTVLLQTIGVLRSRRRLKRLGMASALAACFLAGMFTMSLWQGSISSGGSVASGQNSSASGSATDSLPDELRSIRADGEIQLAAAKLTPYRRLCRTGDRQLAEETDIPGAIRTYKQALKVASAAERAVSLDHDSWLLMAMKNDQPNSLSAEKMP